MYCSPDIFFPDNHVYWSCSHLRTCSSYLQLHAHDLGFLLVFPFSFSVLLFKITSNFTLTTISITCNYFSRIDFEKQDCEVKGFAHKIFIETEK